MHARMDGKKTTKIVKKKNAPILTYLPTVLSPFFRSHPGVRLLCVGSQRVSRRTRARSRTLVEPALGRNLRSTVDAQAHLVPSPVIKVFFAHSKSGSRDLRSGSPVASRERPGSLGLARVPEWRARGRWGDWESESVRPNGDRSGVGFRRGDRRKVEQDQ